jgi:hypothetical protein
MLVQHTEPGVPSAFRHGEEWRVLVWEKGWECRFGATSLDISPAFWYACSRGLGTSLRRRETVRLMGPFQLSGLGSLQEYHAGVKHSWSIITLLSRKQFSCLCEVGRAFCQNALYLASAG